MSSGTVDIWSALKSGVNSLNPKYAVAWPAERFEPPVSPQGKLLPYIRIATVGATPARLLVKNGGAYDRAGFLIITLVYPMLSTIGFEDYLKYPSEIAGFFNDGMCMRGDNGVIVAVSSKPQVMEGFEQDGYWTIPVRIPWRVFI